MHTGKTLFAQLMDFLPGSTFARIVARYNGDRSVRTLPCTSHFRVMAFAQLTYRESLRDIEVCLTAQAGKLYHMGFRERIHRSTLADANEVRDWRIYAEFAQRLIAQARRLYADDALGVDLDNPVYALDSTTIDLLPFGIPLGALPIDQGCGEDAYPAGPPRQHPEFHPHLRRQAARCPCTRHAAARTGAIYVMDRDYVDFSRLHVLHQAGAFFVTRAKSNLDAHRV